MSLLDDLRSLREEPQSVWLEFLGAYKIASFDLYLFFEGRPDFSFYQPHIRSVWSDRGKLIGFNCRGKDAVVEVMQRVKQSLDYEWRALFFLDKDLDDFCGFNRHSDKFLYETEYYSIENYIASQATLEVVCTDFLQLRSTDPRYDQVFNLFASAYKSFCDLMKEVTAMVIHLRRNGFKVVLNDVSMDKLVKVDAECRCLAVTGWQQHILAASNTHGVDPTDLSFDAVTAELTVAHPKTYIRGKFDLWFFVMFLHRIVPLLTSKELGKSRLTCTVQITEGNAVDLLAARTVAPESLRTFLSAALPVASVR